MKYRHRHNNPPLHTPGDDCEVIELSFDSQNAQQSHVMRELNDLGVDLLMPMESKLAQAMGDFSYFLLSEENFDNIMLPILQKYMDGDDPPVGELQGGDDSDSPDPSSSIFRVVLPSKPIQELLIIFHKTYPHHKSFTEQSILEYMLEMCNSNERNVHPDLHIASLGNPMLIFGRGSFTAPPFGQQIPHIDHCQPNVQVGVYMNQCPATLVMESAADISSIPELLEYWEEEYREVPGIIREALLKTQDEPLTGLFADWHTLNTQLSKFGKLFARIDKMYRVTNVMAGTTLLAHDNPIHAGPPFSQPRMFAYAIGIPTDEGGDGDTENGNSIPDDKNDGEIQYNAVLLHVDLCCILFTKWESDANQQTQAPKRWLLEILPDMIRQFPYENFQRLLLDERAPLRQWLYDLWEVVVAGDDTDGLFETAVQSKSIFYNSNGEVMAHATKTIEENKRWRRKERQNKKKTDATTAQ